MIDLDEEGYILRRYIQTIDIYKRSGPAVL